MSAAIAAGIGVLLLTGLAFLVMSLGAILSSGRWGRACRRFIFGPTPYWWFTDPTNPLLICLLLGLGVVLLSAAALVAMLLTPLEAGGMWIAKGLALTGIVLALGAAAAEALDEIEHQIPLLRRVKERYREERRG